MKVSPLKIEKGSLVFLIGELGSGKSSFINFLLNELKLITIPKSHYLDYTHTFDLEINGKISYVA